jgi:hypothetical protein
MRLKAPEGKGHPTVAGIESHGYVDVDAPAKAVPAAGNPRGKADPGLLRGAALTALKALGVVIPAADADDKAIADALVGAAKALVDGATDKAEPGKPVPPQKRLIA